MDSLFYFIIAIAILVVVHEFGHFWVARRCGVKVLKFSVGFGPVLFKRKAKNGTEYALSAIPLGGFVKMLDEREGEVDPSEKQHAFNHQSLIKRTAIIAAGPIANLIFAFCAYWFVFVIGINGIKPVIGDVKSASIAEQAGLQSGDLITSVNGSKTTVWNQVIRQLVIAVEDNKLVTVDFTRGTANYSITMAIPEVSIDNPVNLLANFGIRPYSPDYKPVLGQVVKDGAADQVGLKVGDQLIAANGEVFNTWQSWVELIQSRANQPIKIEFLRLGKLYTVNLTPIENTQGKGVIGAAVDPKATDIPDDYFATLRLSPFSAVSKAFQETWQFSALTIKGIWGMLTGTVSLKNIGGPITIAEIAGASAENGVVSFLQMLAIISISLGILNLLPIPVLDGGHLVFNLIEAIKGSPVTVESQMTAQKVGMVLLLSLMILAFFNDLTRLFG
jgi:regulator of sigma E protease